MSNNMVIDEWERIWKQAVVAWSAYYIFRKLVGEEDSR